MKQRSDRIERLVERISGLPGICVQRGVAFTESYKKTEGLPPVIRQAMANAYYLETMTLDIPDDELLVGNPTSKPRAGALLPEISIKWLTDELDNMSVRDWDRFEPITPEERQTIFDIMPYWDGKSLVDRWKGSVPKEDMALYESGYCGGLAFSGNIFYPAHMSINWERALRYGLSGIRKMAEDRLGEIGRPSYEELDSYHFYQGVCITLDGVARFAERYAELAESLADSGEKSAERTAELREIARVCRKVPNSPPDSYYEAIQAVAIIWVALEIENWGHGAMLGRPDQYLYKYYKNDVETGAITDDRVVELTEMLYIKLNSTVSLDDYRTATVFAGFPQIVNIVLGGVDKEGKNAVNELSYLFLEADRTVRLPMEDLVVRIGRETPREFIYKAAEVAKELKGKIKFVGDEVHLKQLTHDGYPLELARDYIVTGCNSPAIQGVSLDVPGGVFNLPLMLEYALNDGVSRMTGNQVGLKTGDPRKLASYDDIWDAFVKQTEYFVENAALLTNVDREMFAKYAPTPFQSALFTGPLEKGCDIFNGGISPYGRQAISICGAPNVGDSLAAIKKCLFEDKTITIQQLIDALDADFEGFEDVRYMLAKAPKFGNDEDYVDKLVDESLITTSNIVKKYMAHCGNPFNIAAAAITANVPHGAMLGATPDGRRAGTPISEGGISPQQGNNVSGPTATLKSVSKLTHTSYTNGAVLNMRINPASMKDEKGMNKFVDMLYTYFCNDGPFVQFNIIDTETLKAAQRDPEKYKDLLIRIATYTAYFIELSPQMQDDIITRMELEV